MAFALCGPGFEGGGRVKAMVSLLDLPPTLLDACGIPVPEQFAGRSLVPLVNRQTQDWPGDVFVQISESQVGRAIRTQRWKYCVVARDKSGWAEPGSDCYTEDALYDLLADPYELNNLIGLDSHQAVTARMRARLLARMQQAGEPLPEIFPAEARPGGQKLVLDSEINL